MVYFKFILDAKMINYRTSLTIQSFSTFGIVRNNNITSQHDKPSQGVVRLFQNVSKSGKALD